MGATSHPVHDEFIKIIDTYTHFWEAMDAYMDLRKSQGIGHRSPQGKALAEAYEALKAVQK